MTSRIPAVCMGKPIGATEKLYNEHSCDGISVWIDKLIEKTASGEIHIGYTRFLFFGELTLKGLSTTVCIR